MTRDPEHKGNPLPWEAPAPGQRPFFNEGFAYVLTRADALTLLLVAAESIQAPCCDDVECPGRVMAHESWHALYWDLSPADRQRLMSALVVGGLKLPEDPQASA